MATSNLADVVLREDRDDHVSVLRLHRPDRLNAWGPDMASRLAEHLADLDADRQTRVAVLTGSGDRAFSSGADVGQAATHTVGSIGEYLADVKLSGHPAFESISTFTKPLICAVNGYAIGAGFLVALRCDIILASDTAVFSLPQAQLGIIPAYGGLARLAGWVGRGNAMHIGLTGRRVDAHEARAMGLVASTHAAAELEDAALELASQLAAAPPLALKLTKESLNLGLEMGGSTRAAGIADLYRFLALEQTEDCAEAHQAWREKRRPQYQSR